MIALALVCLLLAAAAVAFILAEGTQQVVDFSFFAGDFSTNPAWIFVAGAATMLLADASLALFRRGTQRTVARRREIKRLRKIEETTTVPAAGPATRAPGEHHRTPSPQERTVSTGPSADETLVRPPRHEDEGPQRLRAD